MAVLKTRLLIAFLMLLSVSQIFSQNIVISGNNGELEYMDGLPVLKAESYSCFNKNASDASWRIVISSLALSDGVWYRSSGPVEKFDFSVSDFSRFAFNMADYDCKMKVIGTKKYCKGWIISKSNLCEDSLGVYFDLLPPKPSVKEYSWSYSSFDYDYWEFVDGYYDCVIQAEDCEQLELKETDLNWLDYFEYGTITTSYVVPKETQGKDLYHIKSNVSNLCSWEHKICFTSSNSFGTSLYSDTISPRSYISEDLLKVFEKVYSGIESSQLEVNQVTVLENCILCPMEWKQLQVFGMDGKCYYHSSNYQPSVKLPNSLKGLYVIRVLFPDNKKTIKKIKL